MAILKKNIWLLFYCLGFFSLILLVTLTYMSWKNIYREYQISQEHMVSIIASSTRSLFKTQETVLNVVGNRFLEDPQYKNNPRSMATLNSTLKDNPSMEAIALVTPGGTMTFSSGGYDISQFPNLLKQETSRDSFLQTLKSHNMVFGRTYYFAPINQWITPIRKAIRDDNGNIITIITAALRVDDTFGNFVANVDKSHNYFISILRDEDFYFQYVSPNSDESNHQIYLTPLASSSKERIVKAIMDSNNVTIEDVKEHESMLSFLYTATNGKTYLLSLQYDKMYKLWIHVRLPLEIIKNEFLKSLALYLLIYSLVLLGFFFLFRVIAKADAKRSADLIFQATHDPLTTLPNRSYLQKNIQKWLFTSAPDFSILYVDMDHFKNINDSFGHQCGDYLLVELTKRLKTVIPEDSIIIRHGGDEFVIFTHVTHDQALLVLAYHIIETVSKPYYIDKLTLNVGASIGIAKYPEHGDTLDMLLRAADIAMYESKKIKNNAYIFENTMQESYLKNISIELELKKALEHNELFMVYQPQIDQDGHMYGVESLARWSNASLGMVPPDQFIAVAEESGQMGRIGRFIINRTLQDIKEVQTVLGVVFQTSINISVRQFMEVGFLEHLLHAIAESHMSNIAITIEVTENLLIEDIDYILPLLHDIKKAYIQISMDDFGTGYSSLSMLRKLPIDELKIDKSFIDTIVEDETTQKMVQNIIAIGKNFNMQVVAEGVETKEQRMLLHSLGCDRFQGYYFAKPLMKEDLIAFFKAH